MSTCTDSLEHIHCLSNSYNNCNNVTLLLITNQYDNIICDEIGPAAQL